MPASSRVLYMEALGEAHLHQVHKGGGTHQHLLSPDIGGQTSPLITAQVVRPAKNGPLGPKQIVKQFGQAAAGVPDQRGGTPHHLLNGPVSKDLDDRSPSVMSTRSPFRDWAIPGQPARAPPLWARRRATLWKGRP